MEQAGLPPMAVLKSATGTSAATLAFPEKIGRIAPGYRSRFILTRHDPLESVASLQKDKTIFFDGQSIRGDSKLDAEGL